jgi:hypothetical protein
MFNLLNRSHFQMTIRVERNPETEACLKEEARAKGLPVETVAEEPLNLNPVIVSATDAILGHEGVLCFTAQNVGEFWNACTRPIDRNGYGLSPQQPDRLAKTFKARLRLLPDSLGVHEEGRSPLVAPNDVSGVQVHDARLVAAMRVHGVRHILTFNDKDFARYTDIQALHPRAASSS